jgi:hypothetical protein
MTTILRPASAALLTPPSGTPSRSTAQLASIPRRRRGSTSSRISGEAYERHDALYPTASRLVVEEIVPTMVRAPSVPRTEEPSRPSQRLALPAPAQSRPAPVANKTSPVVPVLLVLLAAAIAGTIVYFAL